MNSYVIKKEKLEALLSDMGGVVIAYSGGVDSTLLLAVAHECLGDKALAVIGRSETVPQREYEEAVSTARSIGARFEVVETKELEHPRFASNPPDRCYLCKSELFSKLKAIAEREGLQWVVDGANVDDILEWARPLSAGAPNLVLDLSSVTVCTPNCIRLLREIDALCAKRNGQWALVAGDAVRHRLRSRDGSLSVPLADSVAQAEHHFDDAVTARRRLVLPLLGRTA